MQRNVWYKTWKILILLKNVSEITLLCSILNLELRLANYGYFMRLCLNDINLLTTKNIYMVIVSEKYLSYNLWFCAVTMFNHSILVLILQTEFFM